MDQRVRFIAECIKGELSVAELCRRFGISRKTGHKWIVRYGTAGPEGLRDRSHRPHSHPRTTPPQLVDGIVGAKKAFPSLGPKKIKALLARYNPQIAIPAASTIGEILKRHGWVTPRKHRHKAVPSSTPLAHANEPNAVWCVDFKGWFCTGRVRCYPLTLIDAYSRYLLRCEALRRPRGKEVRQVICSAFEQFGLPQAIRSDNGPPFASTGPGALTPLSVWWVKLGIRLERIEPGKPQQNGRQERFHLTLKKATASPPESSFRAQQRTFQTYRAFYNEVRPHEALGQRPPTSAYYPCDRRLPERARDPSYQDPIEPLLADDKGAVTWRGRRIHVGQALAREVVGLEHLQNDLFALRFGPVELGTFVYDRPRGGLIRLTPPQRKEAADPSP